MPVRIDGTLESLWLVAGLAPKFAANLLDGLGADRAAMRERIESSPVIVTLLAPKIGYQRAAALFKESLATGRTIRELAVGGGIATDAEIDALLR